MKFSSLVALITAFSLVLAQEEWLNPGCPQICDCRMTEWVAPTPEVLTSWRKTEQCRNVKDVSIPDDAEVLNFDGSSRIKIPQLMQRVAELNNVVDLSMASCNLSSLDCGWKSTSLLRLNMNENALTELSESSIRGFPNLEELTIERNILKHIESSTFRNASNLKSLRLDSNLLDSLDWLNGTDGLNGLTKLVLGGNRLKYPILANGTFSKLASLRDLVLDGMGIRRIENGAFKGLELLETLDLDGNALQCVPSEALRFLPKLKFLNMNDNLIKQLGDKSFSELRNLVSVELTNQPELRLVDDRSFFNLESLERVLLFGNPMLSYIGKDAFVSCPQLSLIDLHDTMIESLDKDVVDGLPSLVSIEMKGNPINCNCVMMWLKDWLVDQTARDKVVCASPPRYRLSRLVDVNDNDVTCAPTVQPTFPLRMVVPDTQQVVLNCRTFGIPQPKIVWFLSSGDIIRNQTEAQRHQMNLDGSGTLTIMKPESGDYACTAENNRGMASRKTSVQVLHSTTIKSQVNTQPAPTTMKSTPEVTSADTQRNPTFAQVDATTKIESNTLSKLITQSQSTTTNRKTSTIPTTTEVTIPTIMSTKKNIILTKTTKQNRKVTDAIQSTTKKAVNEDKNKAEQVIPIYIPVPKVQILEVTATSALITWRSPNQLIEFMKEYSPYEMMLSLEHDGRVIYTDKVEPISVFPSWEVESPEYNISLLEPQQTYKVCLIVSCCAPYVRENKYCTMLHTKIIHNEYENIPLAISLSLCVVILIIGFYLLVRCGPHFFKQRWNNNAYIGLDEQRGHKFEIPMNELYPPLMQGAWESDDTPKQSDRLINTTASTVYT
ncbi:uncharacterized protein LOC100178863 [Ciona intestinalis]